MNVATTRIEDWGRVRSSGHTIDFVDNTALVASTSNDAYLNKNLTAHPGEVVTLSFKAKVVSGSLSAVISINGTGFKQQISVVGEDWQEYSLTYTVHDTVKSYGYLDIRVGAVSEAGVGNMTDLRVAVEQGVLAAPRVYASGLLKIANGAMSVHSKYSAIGLNKAQVLTTPATTSFLLWLKPTGGNAAGSAPIFSADFTIDNAATRNLKVRAGGYDSITGRVIFEITDETGTLVDISTIGTCYIWLLALGS